MKPNPNGPDIKSCGVLVFRKNPNHSFLLMEHADRWDLPKGHMDPGEGEQETALRELVEETGITADDIEIDSNFRFGLMYTVQKKRYGREPKRKELVIFLAELKNDVELTLTEHIGYSWFEWSPPHQIQTKSIDPVLGAVELHWEGKDPA